MGIFDFFKNRKNAAKQAEEKPAAPAQPPRAEEKPEVKADARPASQPEPKPTPKPDNAPAAEKKPGATPKPDNAPAAEKKPGATPQPAQDKAGTDGGDDQPDVAMRMHQRLMAVLSLSPTLQELADDPETADHIFNQLLMSGLHLLVTCSTTVEKQPGNQVPKVRLNASLGNSIVMVPPDELKGRIAGMSFDDRCLLIKALWLDAMEARDKGQRSMSEHLLNYVLNELNPEEVLSHTSLPVLRHCLHEAQAARKQDKEYVQQLMTALGQALANAKQLFVAFDQMVRMGRYPFIEADGRALLFTEMQLAVNAGAFYEQNKLGKLHIVNLSGEKLKQYFASLADLGIGMIRVDNGAGPAEVALDQVYPGHSPELADEANRGMRGLMLREMEVGARMQAYPAEKGSKEEKSNAFWLLTARYNAYSRMGHGLFYVLVAHESMRDDVTYCTPAAQEQAAKLAETFADSTLRAPGTTEVALYEKPLQLRVANKPGSTEVNEGYVCVFTNRADAMAVTERFRALGRDDMPVIVTFHELLGQAAQCAGIVVDMNNLSMEIPKAAYGELKQYAELGGTIMVQLK